jgi:hypothetical protein
MKFEDGKIGMAVSPIEWDAAVRRARDDFNRPKELQKQRAALADKFIRGEEVTDAEKRAVNLTGAAWESQVELRRDLMRLA